MGRMDEKLEQAKAALAAGTLTAAMLDDLTRAAKAGGQGAVRQRLLYLHAAHPSMYSPVVDGAVHEPVGGRQPRVDPLVTELPYATVHEAVQDGWRIVHFPNQRSPFDDREIDVIGYEFILEKMEPCDA